ncbi:DivIVA domain-containing protein [Actinoplanes italicus]|uniref:DivIVA domain-containing protein n=1 Tax=Actinoplanes italicus TaxID=113567 RepID=A0A2T0KFL7_9ACTN|nr:DivIVA domain-containing protein [Actinoplanes italicus]PRX22165.1 DivIVA domain-containing protein [Actinoplanes italicus]
MASAIYDAGMSQDFTVVLRGYDRQQVDELLGRGFDALGEDSGPARRAAARDALRAASFDVTLRGYDRMQVDKTVEKLLRELDGPAPAEDLWVILGSVLRIPEPTDQSIVDEVRRLRDLADRHGW